ncbi:MAG: glycosyltransferase family 2 protein [Candidatus Thorarchaeota archaeon]
MNNLSVIVPAYNEERSLKNIIEELVSVLDHVPLKYEIIIVDDGSKDATPKIADILSKRFKFVRTVHHNFNIGYGGAQKTGFRAAKYDLVTIVPSDDQFNVRDIKKYFPLMKENVDAVLGVRVNRNDPLFRKINTRLYNLILNIFFGLKLRDVNWVKMIRRKYLVDMDINSKGICVDAEVIIKLKDKKCRFKEVEVGYYKRKYGNAASTSFLSILITLTELMDLWIDLFIKKGIKSGPNNK